MQSQADIQGVINALTHLNVLEPSQARKDTLATLYMNEVGMLRLLIQLVLKKMIQIQI